MKTSVKPSVKASLIVVALALLACLVWLVSRPGGPDAASVPEASRGPSFAVRIEKPRSCRPADGAVGYLRATERAGSGELDGSFVVEPAACENAETGRVIEWPPAPLTLRGSFAGLPHGRRQTSHETARRPA